MTKSNERVGARRSQHLTETASAAMRQITFGGYENVGNLKYLTAVTSECI